MSRLLAPLLLRMVEMLDQSLMTVPDADTPLPALPATTRPNITGKARR
jgi:hypothetical protein